MRTRNIPSRIRTLGRLARALRRRPLQRKPRITSLNLGGDKRLIAFKERPADVYAKQFGKHYLFGEMLKCDMTVVEFADEMNSRIPALRAMAELYANRA